LTFNWTVSAVSCLLVFRVTSLCAQKSLLPGSIEPSDHSGPSWVPEAGGSAGAEVEAVGDSVGEALAFGELCEVSPEPELGFGATGLTGVRLVASGDGVGVGRR
jgi:hypothetical protein